MEKPSDIRSALIDARLKNVDIYIHELRTTLNNHHSADKTCVIATWEYMLDAAGTAFFAWRDGHWTGKDQIAVRGPIPLALAFHYIDVNWDRRRKAP